MLDADTFRALVEAGVAAPSADNSHCVTFEHGRDAILVRDASGARSRPVHRQQLFLIALGAIVENMTVAASARGLEADVQTFAHERAANAVVARVALHRAAGDTRCPEPVGALAAAITERHTNRRFYKGPKLPSTELDALSRAAERFEGTRVVWLDGREARRAVLGLVRAAEGERFRDPALHAELFSSIRFDLGWHRAADEGLAPGTLGVERPLRVVFAALRHRAMPHVMRVSGSAALLGMRAGDLPCRLAPHVGVIASSLELAAGAIAAGRALERVWLAATVKDLALQPLAASTLFALEGYTQVRVALRSRLQRGWAKLTPDAHPHLVFRLGHAPKPALRNARRPVESYLALRDRRSIAPPELDEQRDDDAAEPAA